MIDKFSSLPTTFDLNSFISYALKKIKIHTILLVKEVAIDITFASSLIFLSLLLLNISFLSDVFSCKTYRVSKGLDF